MLKSLERMRRLADAMVLIAGGLTLSALAGCQAWAHNIDGDGGFFVDISVADAVIEEALQQSGLVAVLFSVDDQESTLEAQVCASGTGQLRVKRGVGGAFEDEPQTPLSFTAAANLEDCGDEATARAELWAMTEIDCDTADSEVATPVEPLFRRTRLVVPEEMRCTRPIEAAVYGTLQAGPTPPDRVSMEIIADDRI